MPSTNSRSRQPSSVHFVCGKSGYFHKDLEAVRGSPSYDPLDDNIKAVTPGFRRIVEPGDAISVIIKTPNGSVAIGDCVDVIFSGYASRDPLFAADEHLPTLNKVVLPWLMQCDLSQFRRNAAIIDAPWWQLQHQRLHSAIRYGLSQALLSAAAAISSCTLTEVIAREWSCEITSKPVDILASCHRNDDLQLDRMIMKRIGLLPHASFVHVDDIGAGGGRLLDYIHHVSRRVLDRRDPCYHPRLHFDVYGTIGDAIPGDDMPDFFERIQEAAEPFTVLIESPIIASTRELQITRLRSLKERLSTRRIAVQLVADEWCNTLEDIREFVAAQAVDFVQVKTPDLGSVHNTIEAVLYCRENNMGCCLGGSANETDISARATAQIALATQPDFLLSKPGIGADEGVMILTNEMLRTLVMKADNAHCMDLAPSVMEEEDVSLLSASAPISSLH